MSISLFKIYSFKLKSDFDACQLLNLMPKQYIQEVSEK